MQDVVMRKVITCICFVLAFSSMCKKNNDEMPDFSILNGNNFILRVDRVSLQPKVQFPRDSLRESDYIVSNSDIQYGISFSGSGQNVSITPGPVLGEKTKDGKESKYYELNDGLFAGGRFIVWKDKNEFEAEYTIYGSGFPIIKSERGRLELKSN